MVEVARTVERQRWSCVALRSEQRSKIRLEAMVATERTGHAQARSPPAQTVNGSSPAAQAVLREKATVEIENANVHEALLSGGGIAAVQNGTRRGAARRQ